jgi:hypothetical protein
MECRLMETITQLEPVTAGLASARPAPALVVATVPLRQVVARTVAGAARRAASPVGLGVTLLIAAAALVIVVLQPAQTKLVGLQTQLGNLHSLPGAASMPASPAAFTQQLPGVAQLPAAMLLIIAQAEKSNVTLNSGKYQLLASGSKGLPRYQINLPVEGNYVDIRNFVDSALLAVPAMALERVRMERESVDDSQVKVELQFAIYVKESA